MPPHDGGAPPAKAEVQLVGGSDAEVTGVAVVRDGGAGDLPLPQSPSSSADR